MSTDSVDVVVESASKMTKPGEAYICDSDLDHFEVKQAFKESEGPGYREGELVVATFDIEPTGYWGEVKNCLFRVTSSRLDDEGWNRKAKARKYVRRYSLEPVIGNLDEKDVPGLSDEQLIRADNYDELPDAFNPCDEYFTATIHVEGTRFDRCPVCDSNYVEIEVKTPNVGVAHCCICDYEMHRSY
ncbi:hypothetical protein [Halosegnis longus]|uniref:hypothetical protein n=1 Tax=Halosegnis longus TaxID=2216012 RepID=UPI00129E8103|nr:hypothetical protein [Halosegnis longus]